MKVYLLLLPRHFGNYVQLSVIIYEVYSDKYLFLYRVCYYNTKVPKGKLEKIEIFA